MDAVLQRRPRRERLSRLSTQIPAGAPRRARCLSFALFDRGNSRKVGGKCLGSVLLPFCRAVLCVYCVFVCVYLMGRPSHSCVCRVGLIARKRASKTVNGKSKTVRFKSWKVVIVGPVQMGSFEGKPAPQVVLQLPRHPGAHEHMANEFPWLFKP